MFSWGELHLTSPSDVVQDGEPEDGLHQFFTPATRPVITQLSASRSVVVLTTSDRNTYFRLRQRDRDGNVTFGKKKAVKCNHVVDSSSGDSSLLLLSRDGVVVHVDHSSSAVPRSLQNVINKRVVQVACGDQHSIILTQDGQALAWGSNARGQLGLALPESSVVQSPTPVEALSGVPLVQVSAGGGHSLALSVSGTVFGWGQNNVGQLGLGDTADRSAPVTVECLNLKKIIYVSCGETHTAVLTKGGVVFTFGGGGCGQLGHNSLGNELRPRVVAELWGAAVRQISCGSNHTMALVGPTKKIYSCGRGEEGQLGNGVTTACLVPLPVLLPRGDGQCVQRIFAGGNQSFALCTLSQEPEKDFTRTITTLDLDTINFWLSKCPNAKSWRKIQKQIKDIFSSASTLNASFLDRSADKHHQTSARCSGLDVDLVTTALDKLETSSKVLQEVEIVVQDYLLPSLRRQPVGVEGLRVYYVLVQLLQVLVRSNNGEQPSVAVAVAGAFLSLHKDRLEVLVGLWSTTPNFFRSAVKTFCDVVTIHLSLLDVNSKERNVSIRKTAQVLQRLYHASRKDSPCLAHSAFHVESVQQSINMFVQLCRLKQGIMARFRWNHFEFNDDERRIINNAEYYAKNLMFLVRYPCILPMKCKLILWGTHLIKTKQSQQAIGFLVHRDTVQKDTFHILRTSTHDPKSPLKVTFLGEQGYDVGGVSMEFFRLLAKEVQKAELQILEVNEHKMAWFSQNLTGDGFFILGMICGMALYNQCLMNIPFPLALFKKLLDVKPSLDDLQELSPTVAQSLKELLDYEEEVALDLDLDFGWSADMDLLPNGQSIPVTKINRQKYVELHVDMVLSRSVEYQFEEFRSGFRKGCPSDAWTVFLPEQLMTALKGEEVFNWDDLRQNAQYLGCTPNDEVVKNFWTVFAELSVEQKQDFLIFLTGADRIPKVRSSTITITIKLSSYPDPEVYYPVAETCFWRLNLPNYGDIETLRQKLLHAVECCHVFGIE